jgi:carbamate kinase
MSPAGTDRAVVALGGNALLRRGEPLEAANQAPCPLAVRAGQIGYVLEMQLDNCIDHQDTVAVTTRVVVDGDDPAFRPPSKFIGPLYTEAQASDVADRHGWTM